MPTITAPAVQAHNWAATILSVLRTAWPYGAAHSSRGPDDCDVTPTRLHPAFHGCLDWHSSVHMQWSAIRLLGLDLGVGRTVEDDLRAELIAELDTRLTPENGRVEAGYLRRARGYERPYGWGWAVMLGWEVRRLVDSPTHPLHRHAVVWDQALRPIVEVVADHLIAWLPTLAYPVRHGVHSNTAFAMALARDAYSALGRSDVVSQIDARVSDWFLADVDYPSSWEPSGADFLSPALCQAVLVGRVLPAAEFSAWLNTFLPGLAEPGDNLLDVPVVLDRTDGHAVHLFGLGLSRAAHLRFLAPFLDAERAERALAGAQAQVDAALAEISGGDFMSTHWLVSFALLAEADHLP